MKPLAILLAFWLALLAWACPPPHESARDTIAFNKGILDSVQADYLEKCTANPEQRICQEINRAGNAHNLAIQALIVYCGSPEFEAGAPCTPPANKEVRKQLHDKLKVAVKNLQEIIRNLKEIAQ